MYTFDDLKEKLKQEDELTVLELLDVTSVELVDILEGYVEDKQEYLRGYYGEESEELDR